MSIWHLHEQCNYVILSHVATGDLATAALQNTLLDDVAAIKTNINDDGSFKLVSHTYAVTLADVANSLTKTLVASFSMPANEMADKHQLRFWLAIKTKNYVTGATQPTIRFEWGASTVTLPSSPWSNGNVENLNLVEFVVTRVGADLWIRTQSSALATPGPLDLIGLYDLGAATANSQFNTVLSAPTFTSTQTVGISVQFPTADAAIYWKTPAGGAVRRPIA